MASEITADPASMMESDMPESSMGRESQGIPVNQSSLSNFLECITQKLQEISMAQMNPQEMRTKDKQPATIQPRLPLKVVQEFQACLSSSNCDRLLEMVNEFHAELFLQTFDEEYSRSALHVAVLKGSQTLIHALMKELKALFGGNDPELFQHDFILKKDEYGLCAADMAALIGNEEIISCFEQRLQVFDNHKPSNPFRRSPTSEDEKRDLLEKASPLLEKQALKSSDQGTRPLSIQEWLHENDIDFVYCLHTLGDVFHPSLQKAKEFVEHVSNTGDLSFLEPLLNVRDSLGKSPLHDPFFFLNWPIINWATHFPNLDWNMPDFCGRTPLHLAALQGYADVVTFLANREGTNLNATFSNTKDREDNRNANFNNSGVSNVTPLHLAVLYNRVDVVQALLEVRKEPRLDVNAVCFRRGRLPNTSEVWNESWTPIQLAAFMGHDRIVKIFLKDSRLYDPGLKNGNESAPQDHNMIPALHLAAAQFHPLVVKTLVVCTKMDTLVREPNLGDTALHHAARHADENLDVYTNLFDYVITPHFTSKPPEPRKPSDYDMITCFEILMQSGLDMEQKSDEGTTPTLHRLCPEKVQIWWLEKMAKEAQENKNNLITAANAVSVTAALVATASFVGPLQPPLGLLDDGNQTWLDGYSQVQHTSIQVFLFCVSLSFYLAIAAIVFAMLPSWPIPHEGLAQEVRIARRCVQVAVLLLFGSIIFVVCAFSAASIAIVPDQRWRYKTIAVISTSLGVLICFLILFLSFMRLLTLISSKNEVAMKISNVATRIILWEWDTSFAK